VFLQTTTSIKENDATKGAAVQADLIFSGPFHKMPLRSGSLFFPMRKNRLTIVFSLFLSVASFFILCFSASARPRIKILTTVFPLMEFAREVAGDRGDVGLFLPPGAEVHTWQPRFSDMEKLSRVDAFVYIGQGLEPWAVDVLRGVRQPGLKVLEISRDLPLLRSGQEGLSRGHESERLDPHLWLDFQIDEILVGRIQSLLTEIEPDQADVFARGASAYKEKLNRLDGDYRKAFERCELNAFIFSGHAAFGYLARRYHLRQISAYGLSPDSTPTPKDLARIIEMAGQLRVPTIFYETGAGPKLARQIAASIGADILPLNPGHTLTKSEWNSGTTFLDLMRMNLENLRHGLHCR
jgi:zinc transport system substrate-binding protein